MMIAGFFFPKEDGDDILPADEGASLFGDFSDSDEMLRLDSD